MKWILLVFLLISCNSEEEEMRLFISSLGNTGEAPEPPFPANGVRVVLLTGQSNAAGSAPYTSATTEELAPHPDLQIYQDATVDFGAMQLGVNNLGTGLDRSGMEIGMALNITDYFPEPLNMIKWGVAGTGIVEHLEGGSVYTKFLNWLNKGITKLIADGYRPFVYMVFVQGEKDSNTQEDTDLYPARFDEWTKLWQANIGADLPFNIVEIHVSDEMDTEINNAFHNQAAVENYMDVIDTSDIGVFDGLHFNYAGLKILGDRVLENITTQTPIEITAPL